MTARSPASLARDCLAQVAAALASPQRLELLEYAAQGPRSVEALAKLAGLTIANASRHLQVLRAAGLVGASRRGRQVFYGLPDGAAGPIIEMLAALRQVAERSVPALGALLDGWFAARDPVEPVSRSELLRRVRDGRAVVLDVRPGGGIRARPSARRARHPAGRTGTPAG